MPNVNNQDGRDWVTVHNVCDLSMSCRQLINDQESDQEVNQLTHFAVNEEEASHQVQCFYHKTGILMRKGQPRDASAIGRLLDRCTQEVQQRYTKFSSGITHGRTLRSQQKLLQDLELFLLATSKE